MYLDVALKTFIIRMAVKDRAGDHEDFNARKCSGENFDDAYNIGVRDGEILMARHIYNELTGTK